MYYFFICSFNVGRELHEFHKTPKRASSLTLIPFCTIIFAKLLVQSVEEGRGCSSLLYISCNYIQCCQLEAAALTCSCVLNTLQQVRHREAITVENIGLTMKLARIHTYPAHCSQFQILQLVYFLLLKLATVIHTNVICYFSLYIRTIQLLVLS